MARLVVLLLALWLTALSFASQPGKTIPKAVVYGLWSETTRAEAGEYLVRGRVTAPFAKVTNVSLSINVKNGVLVKSGTAVDLPSTLEQGKTYTFEIILRPTNKIKSGEFFGVNTVLTFSYPTSSMRQCLLKKGYPKFKGDGLLEYAPLSPGLKQRLISELMSRKVKLQKCRLVRGLLF